MGVGGYTGREGGPGSTMGGGTMIGCECGDMAGGWQWQWEVELGAWW